MRTLLVAVSVAVTFALATTAPEESETVPRIVELTAWLYMDAAVSIASAHAALRHEYFMKF